jgi:hypothetical protein
MSKNLKKNDETTIIQIQFTGEPFHMDPYLLVLNEFKLKAEAITTDYEIM